MLITKNYCYGAMRATELDDEIDKQIKVAHRYRNALCELELQRRGEFEAVMKTYALEYLEAKAIIEATEIAIEGLYKAINARSAQSRKKEKQTNEEKAKIAELKVRLKEQRVVCRERKLVAVSDPIIVAALDQANAEHKDRVKSAYHQFDIGWGTKLAVADSAKDFGKGAPPRFTRFDGEGKIAVQLQHGLSSADAMAGIDTRLKLFITEGLKAEVWMRIGSKGRDPVFAKVPFTMHRPLPEASLIKWAYLEKTKIASDTVWQLRLSIDALEEVRTASEELVAVHVGWRKMEGGGLRVATWLGSDGRHGCVELSKRMVDGKSKLSDLKSIRQKRFNRMVKRLSQWIDAMKSRKDIPDWVLEARRTMLHWKSQGRLVLFCLFWRNNRFDGDETAFRIIHGLPDVKNKGWRKWDKHLWLWERHSQVNLSHSRRDVYRNLARQLASKYGRVSIVDADWAKMREKEEVGSDVAKQNAATRSMSQLASVAELNRYIVEAFGKDCVIAIDLKDLTKQCSECGKVDEVDGTKQVHACSGCGEVYDLDANGVVNQLARAKVVLKTQPPLASVMQKRLTTNFDQKKKSKKQEAMDASRKRRKTANENTAK